MLLLFWGCDCDRDSVIWEINIPEKTSHCDVKCWAILEEAIPDIVAPPTGYIVICSSIKSKNLREAEGENTIRDI